MNKRLSIMTLGVFSLSVFIPFVTIGANNKAAKTKSKVTFSSNKSDVTYKDEGDTYEGVKDNWSFSVNIDISECLDSDQFIEQMKNIDENTEVQILFDASFDAYYWMKNNGSGTFSAGNMFGNTIEAIDTLVAPGDIDGDGFQDAVALNGDSQRVWFKNNGKGEFANTGKKVGDSSSEFIALGDVDGNGTLDAFVANSDEGNKVWLNDGNGTFTDSGQSLGDETASINVTLADLNGDGKLDAFSCNEESNRVWLNGVDGNDPGKYSTRSQFLGNEYSYGIVGGDFNGDGYADVFVANDGPSKVWLNQGKSKPGYFTDSGSKYGYIKTTDEGKEIYTTCNAVSLGDVNGDGKDDIFAANSEENRVYLGVGDGTFSDSGQRIGWSTSLSVQLKDLDGDGDLDAFTANDGANLVWLNNQNGSSAGTFYTKAQNLGDATSFGIVTADFDNDGDSDVFVGNFGEPSKMWLNDGKGIFTATDTKYGYIGKGEEGQDLYANVNKVATGHFSGNPLLNDLILACDGKNLLFINFGSGNLVEMQTLGEYNTEGVAVGDVDGDGDNDLFFANYEDPNTVWLNDGTGKFTDSGQRLGTPTTDEEGEVTYPGSFGVALGDIDGDGDLDAFVATADANTVYINDGKGTFHDSGVKYGPQDASGFYMDSREVALVDIDGDGDLDAIVVNYSGPNTVYLNNGGSFPINGSSEFGSGDSNSFVLKDFNKDGNLDVYVANEGEDQLFFGNGKGAFTDSFSTTGQVLGDADSFDLASADFNGDGNQDVFIANYGDNTLWEGNGDGTFITYQFGSSESQGVALADLDGDGDQDAFVANAGDAACKVWKNDGKGNFSDSNQLLGLFDDFYYDCYGVALGDIDGDGDIDAFLAIDGPNIVYLNNGAGVFTDSSQRLGDAYSIGAVFNDVDGDGDLDVIVYNDGANALWLNDGSGKFSRQQLMGEGISYTAAVMDFDKDGDVDQFVANEGENVFWTSNGKGNFNSQQLGNSYSYKAAIGDLNGDGYPDVFVANEGGNKVWFNDGQANFYDSQQALGENDSLSVALGDLDKDGDLDAVVANDSANSVIWVNNGSGVFSASTVATLENSSGTGVALGDINGDGNLDIFIAASDAATIWLGAGDGTFTSNGQTFEDVESYNPNIALVDLDPLVDTSLDAFVTMIKSYSGSDSFEFDATLAEAKKNGGGQGDDETDGKYNKLSLKGEKGGAAKYVSAVDVGYDKTKYKKIQSVDVKWNAKKLTINVKGTPDFDADENILDMYNYDGEYDFMEHLKDQVNENTKKVGYKVGKDGTLVDDKDNFYTGVLTTNCSVVFNGFIWENLGIVFNGTKMDAKYKYIKKDDDDYQLGTWMLKGADGMPYSGKVPE